MSDRRPKTEGEAFREGLQSMPIGEALELRLLHRQFCGSPVPGLASTVWLAHGLVTQMPWLKQIARKLIWRAGNK